jgi:hypothetical protein
VLADLVETYAKIRAASSFVVAEHFESNLS